MRLPWPPDIWLLICDELYLGVVGRQIQGPSIGVGPRRRISGYRRESKRLAELLLNSGGDVRILLEILLSVLPALANPVILVGVPSPTFMHETALARKVQQVPFARDPFAIHHVELRLPERRGHFVFHHLHAHAATRRLVAFLDLPNAPHI